MRVRRITVAALLAVAAASGIACEGDAPSPTGGRDYKDPGGKATDSGKECDTNRVPAEKPNIGDKRYVTIYACVEQYFAPIEVSIHIRDNTTGEAHDQNEPVAGREFQVVVGYDKGHNVTMSIELKPARAGSPSGFLYVTDGPGNRHTSRIDRAWRAQYEFRSAR